MADPLLSCSDRPVCFGDREVLRGHIAGESHRLRHSRRALCIVETKWTAPDPLLADLAGSFAPAARVAIRILLPWLPG